MASCATKGYRVFSRETAPTVPCPCGQSTRIVSRTDGLACNLHVTSIKDSTKHYHRQCTEVYYILEGRGKMELNEDVIEVEPGTVVYIEPHTRHRLFSAEGVQTMIIGIPAWDPNDEFFD